MDRVRSIIVTAAVIVLGMLLGAGVYESVVMAPNYAAHVPESLERARAFMDVANPGRFFRKLAPLAQGLLLLALVLTWERPHVRNGIAAALFTTLLTDVITFTFHYPRNAILFENPLAGVPVERLAQAAREWAAGNYVRIALLFCSVLSALAAHSRLSIPPEPPEATSSESRASAS